MNLYKNIIKLYKLYKKILIKIINMLREYNFFYNKKKYKIK